MKLRIIGLAAALAILAGSASAQTWPATTGNTGKIDPNRTQLRTGPVRIDSASTPSFVSVPNGLATVWVSLLGSAATVSADVVTKAADGTVLSATRVNVGNSTPTLVSFSSPVYFDSVGVSATAGFTGGNNVSATVVQAQ